MSYHEKETPRKGGFLLSGQIPQEGIMEKLLDVYHLALLYTGNNTYEPVLTENTYNAVLCLLSVLSDPDLWLFMGKEPSEAMSKGFQEFLALMLWELIDYA